MTGLRKISKKKLKDIIYKHYLWLEDLWLEGDDEGVKANLSYTNLMYADLENADLRRANLRGADLRRANLRGADLRGVDLRGATLRWANLQEANLIYANLQNADFQYANLQNAALQNADMQHVDLRDANLHGANLQGANLQNIKTNYDTIGIHPAPEGDLIGWGKKNGVIVKFLIPSEARRSCATTRKHRAEYAKVLRVEGVGYAVVENAYGITIYKPGIIVQCHEWDPDRWNECGGGIHFFLTREEAESY